MIKPKVPVLFQRASQLVETERNLNLFTAVTLHGILILFNKAFLWFRMLCSELLIGCAVGGYFMELTKAKTTKSTPTYFYGFDTKFESISFEQSIFCIKNK